MKESNSSIQTRSLACGYSNRTVLKDVSLTLESGTVTAIIGPNGAGKSTLLKTIGGLLPALAGEVSIHGKPIRSYSATELACQIAFVPQHEHFAFRFSTYEVVMMGRLPKSPGVRDTDEDRAAVQRALDFADAASFADRPVQELSGGEQQRVLLARALALESQIVILDEPTTHLDVTHQLHLVSTINAMANEGKTVLAAMHDLNLVGMMANITALVCDGVLRKVGQTEDVLQSEELDRAYGVAFRKIKDGGKTLVLPPLS